MAQLRIARILSVATAGILAFVCTLTLNAQNSNECLNQHSLCPDEPWSWDPTSPDDPPRIEVEIPGYPGCSVQVIYREKDCVDPVTGQTVTEVEVGAIFMASLSSDPDCAGLLALYAQNRPQFARLVWEGAVRQLTESQFVREFQKRINQYGANSPQVLELTCVNGGGRTYRVIQGSCYRTYYKNICPPDASGTDEKGEDSPSLSASGTDPYDGNCLRMRREYCNDDGACCVQEIRYCRPLEQGGEVYGIYGAVQSTSTMYTVGGTSGSCTAGSTPQPEPGEWYDADCDHSCHTPPPGTHEDADESTLSESDVHIEHQRHDESGR